MANDSQQIPTNANIGGGARHIVIDYQGFEQTKDQNNLNTRVTYQSTKEAIQWYCNTTNNPKWKIGTVDPTWGRLDSINSQPGDGPFWKAILSYNQPLSAGIIITTGSDDQKKPTQNSLTVRMMSMPLESHPNYCYIWNHSLATCYGSHQIDYADVSGADIISAQAFVAANSGKVKWIQNDSELPTEPVIQQNGDDTFTTYWRVEFPMTKPGVSTYDFPTYEVVQNARHKSRDQATWSLLAKNGKLRFPEYGDFGIENYFFGNADGVSATTSGHWLCEGAGINYDGKYYVANCTYLFSPDDMGWDRQLYLVADGGYYSTNNHNPNSILSRGS